MRPLLADEMQLHLGRAGTPPGDFLALLQALELKADADGRFDVDATRAALLKLDITPAEQRVPIELRKTQFLQQQRGDAMRRLETIEEMERADRQSRLEADPEYAKLTVQIDQMSAEANDAAQRVRNYVDPLEMLRRELHAASARRMAAVTAREKLTEKLDAEHRKNVVVGGAGEAYSFNASLAPSVAKSS